MAVNQYIGARYVPKFFNNELDTPEWRPNVLYDPLTIVTFLNNSYTSKTQVPANIGSPDQNPQFWAATGNYNAQVEEYRQEVLDLAEDVDDLATEVDLVKNAEITFISDSYMVSSLTDLRDYIQLAFNQPCNFSAIASIGFVHQTSGGETLIDILDNITEEHRNKTKLLVTYAGINDVNGVDYATLNAAVTAYITEARTLYPNARLIVFGPQATPTLSLTENLSIARDAIRDACRLGCVSYYDASMWLYNTFDAYGNTYQADHVHPSTEGCKIIASQMLSAIYGSDNESDIIFTPTPVAGSTLNWTLKSNMIVFDWIHTGADITQGQWVSLFSIDEKYKPFISERSCWPVCKCDASKRPIEVVGYAFYDKGHNRIACIANQTLTNTSICCSGTIILFFDRKSTPNP